MKSGFKSGKIFKVVAQVKKELNKKLYQKSADFLEQHTFIINKYQELEEKIKEGAIGLFLVPFCNNLECEEAISRKLISYSIRCIALNREIEKATECIFCTAS